MNIALDCSTNRFSF